MRWLFLAVALTGCGPNVIVLRDPVTCARTMEAAGFVRLGAWAE